MTEVYMGQIMLTGFAFPPRGFAACNGQLMSINQNQALFSLLGTKYGGDGVTTFALPNLQGRVPVGSGGSVDPNWQPSPYVQGTAAGVESVTLIPPNLPKHAHALTGTTAAGTTKNPTGNLYGAVDTESLYGPTGGQAVLATQCLGAAGANLPHENMQPFNVLNFVIALSGIYPTRT